jgi:hypothetical protein
MTTATPIGSPPCIYRMRDLATVTKDGVVLVRGIIGQSRAWIYQEIRAGRFPPPRRLGPRSSGWISTSIHEWMVTRGVGVGSAPVTKVRGIRAHTGASTSPAA